MAFTDPRNNPGNLKFANQPGAIGADERGFAVFPDPKTGMDAMRRQLELDLVQRGKTGREFIYKYAPPTDNNPTDAYVKNVFGELGIDPDKPVDPAKLPDIQKLMIRQEHGREGMQHYYGAAGQDKTETGSLIPASLAAAAVPVVGASLAAAKMVSPSTRVVDSPPSVGGETYDTNTFGQYRGRSPLFSDSALSAKNKLLSALEAKAERQRQKQEEKRMRAEKLAQYRASRAKPAQQKVSENTICFKDLRQRIQEQIIINEQLEKDK